MITVEQQKSRDMDMHLTLHTTTHFFKFDCLVYEMLFIRALKPNLNVQSDSICLGFRDYAFFFFPANYALFFG